MKTIKFILLTCILLLSSCGNQYPIIDGKNPFIVYSIENFTDNLSLYGGYQTAGAFSGSLLEDKHPYIIARTGLYNIGDTISLLKLKEK